MFLKYYKEWPKIRSFNHELLNWLKTSYKKKS